MSDRIRVLVAVGTMSAGGAERQVLEILKHLDRQKFVPHLFLSQRTGALLPFVPADVPIYAASDRPNWFPFMPGSRMLANWWVLRSLLKNQQIDVVYDTTYLTTLDTAWPCWSIGTPHIAGCVGDPLAELHRYRRLPTVITYHWARWAYCTAYRVVTNSYGLLDQFQALFDLSPDKVSVIPNMHDMAEIEMKCEAAAPQIGSSRFHLLTVGRIDHGKSHPVLLAALKLLSTDEIDWCWHIVGTGPDETSLREQIFRAGLADRVVFHGVVTNPFPFYRHCQLFVFPSQSEGLPNVLIEALASGLPVISTNCPSGPAEILADGQYGTLVPVNDSAAIADAIIDVVRHPNVAATKTQFGQQSVRDRYSIDKVLPQLESLLMQACGKTD